MTTPIEFWFDFSSPYSYLAMDKVEEVAQGAGREVVWRPFLLGAVFKETGNRPLTQQPIKGDYARHDCPRVARYLDMPWTWPDPFPIATMAAARAYYWIEREDPDTARKFARLAFNTYFGKGIDITPAEVVVNIAAGCNVDPAALEPALSDPAVKQALKDRTAEAVERGVCGAPFFFVDGEPFWGSDRLWMVKKWLRTGGW
ncbi:MAG: 2-hydroxychromene-2-carboxylate isomerase [Hyphomicrobiales bacterium]|nr:2-hydroxychromene-2-carboxylate isomerase [Hyphomicrobiales bacterium]MCP5373903.1 2-hydroxychromene-2-carboxylate isomerase [Hyphomicrobiales bacterium]